MESYKGLKNQQDIIVIESSIKTHGRLRLLNPSYRNLVRCLLDDIEGLFPLPSFVKNREKVVSNLQAVFDSDKADCPYWLKTSIDILVASVKNGNIK